MQTPCGKRQHDVLKELKKASEAGEQSANAGERDGDQNEWYN